MAEKFFNLGELNNFDGGVIVKAMQLEIERCSHDCVKRPKEEASRTATLAIKLTPVTDDEGALEGVRMEFQAKSQIPVRKSRKYTLGVRQTGGLLFNDNNPSDVRQKGIDDQIEKNQKEAEKK